jgi:hypothetical protein
LDSTINKMLKRALSTDNDEGTEDTKGTRPEKQAKTIIYDVIELRGVNEACDPTDYLKLCEPLSRDDVYRERPPLVLRDGEIRTEGSCNRVKLSKVCERCRTTHEVVVREVFQNQVSLTDEEIIISVVMGQEDIGPKVYGFDERRIVMEAFDVDLFDFMQKGLIIAMDSVAERVKGLFQRVVDTGYIFVDVKPENIVVRYDDDDGQPTIGSVRLIDFPRKFTGLIHNAYLQKLDDRFPEPAKLVNEAVFKQICAFCMFYVVWLHNFRILGEQMYLNELSWIEETSRHVNAEYNTIVAKGTDLSLSAEDRERNRQVPFVFDMLFKRYFQHMYEHYLPDEYLRDLGEDGEELASMFDSIPERLERLQHFTFFELRI